VNAGVSVERSPRISVEMANFAAAKEIGEGMMYHGSVARMLSMSLVGCDARRDRKRGYLLAT